MRKALTLAAALLLVATPLFAGPNGAVRGDYVEARTAEVFAGGCIMGSEAETMGRQAVLAWRVTEGAIDGVSLDGLAVVLALSADRNLGIREIGGVAPRMVKAAAMVDERATPAQREALIDLARNLANGLADNIVTVRSVPIRFAKSADRYAVTAGDALLDVQTKLVHDMNCGAMKWFDPLASGTEAAIGVTNTQFYRGASLGTKWEQNGAKSAYFGTFSY